MKDIYLDHNIYIQTLEDQELYEFLLGIKKKNNIRFLYSPAHIEEIYKVAANENSKYKFRMEELMQNISDITDNNELLPNLNGIVVRKEDALECYKRVKKYDTRERVEEDSKIRFNEDKRHYNKLLEESKKNKGISVIPFNKIWENDIVKSEIDNLNKNILTIIENYNNSPENILFMKMGINRNISQNLSFKKGNFNILKKSFNDLEYTIEVLFRVLNFCGYNAEKKEKTSISSTHDVTHAIYATNVDYLISNDERFVKKCKAVYYYLGVKTNVIYAEQNNIKEALNSLINN